MCCLFPAYITSTCIRQKYYHREYSATQLGLFSRILALYTILVSEPPLENHHLSTDYILKIAQYPATFYYLLRLELINTFHLYYLVS
jgi:hypothetical protein